MVGFCTLYANAEQEEPRPIRMIITLPSLRFEIKKKCAVFIGFSSYINRIANVLLHFNSHNEINMFSSFSVKGPSPRLFSSSKKQRK